MEGVIVPAKYGHDQREFTKKLVARMSEHLGQRIGRKHYPRHVIYRWSKSWPFPAPESRIRIFDLESKRYLTEETYGDASERLLARGEEVSLVVRNRNVDILDLVDALIRFGSFYRLAETGDPIEIDGSFEENPERINEYANKVPMIITKFSPKLAQTVPGFKPVKKLVKRRGRQEFSLYIDKNYPKFVKKSSISFGRPKRRLANKLFRDCINQELDARLSW